MSRDIEDQITIWIDNREVRVSAGQSIACALLESGVLALRRTYGGKKPRSMFCGMGVCFECILDIDDRRNVRSCMEPVCGGMRVTTSREPDHG